MSEHDPLYPKDDDYVRGFDAGVEQGQRDALAGAVQRVWEMNPVSEDFPDLLDRDAVLAEIQGGGDEVRGSQ